MPWVLAAINAEIAFIWYPWQPPSITTFPGSFQRSLIKSASWTSPARTKSFPSPSPTFSRSLFTPVLGLHLSLLLQVCSARAVGLFIWSLSLPDVSSIFSYSHHLHEYIDSNMTFHLKNPALVEDRSSVPSTRAGWLTTATNSSFRGI